MNRKLISNNIINSELFDDMTWDGIDCDEFCSCNCCVYCINDRISYEAFIYDDWLDSNLRKRKISWFIGEPNTLENISKMKNDERE